MYYTVCVYFWYIDLTAENMATQERKQQENYKNIIEDLGQIHIKAQDALKKLGTWGKIILFFWNENPNRVKDLYLKWFCINTSIYSTQNLSEILYVR